MIKTQTTTLKDLQSETFAQQLDQKLNFRRTPGLARSPKPELNSEQ